MMIDDDVIRLDEVLRLLFRRLHWVLGAAVLFSLLFGAASFLVSPVYRATVVLIPAESGGRLDGALMPALGALSGLAGFSLDRANSHTEESLAVMQSRSFSEKFIQDAGLLPKLFPERWDSQQSRWKAGTSEPPTLASGAIRFDRHVRTLVPDKKTGLFRLTIDWRDPTEAATIANDFVASFNRTMRDRAIKSADESVAYLETELTRTTQLETRANLARLLDAQLNRRMLATVTEEFAFRVVDRALPPDPDDIARPRRGYYLAAGGLIGLVFGVSLVLSRPAK